MFYINLIHNPLTPLIMYKHLHILFFLIINFSYAQNQVTKLIDDALSKAKVEHKYILVNFMATSCEMSSKLNKQLNSDTCKSLFDSSYIVVNIEIPEERAKDYFTHTNQTKKDCKSNGFPFWYILDENGNFIEISYDENGNNIGYPSTKEKIDDFITIIRKTSKLSETSLLSLANSFHSENNSQYYSSK